MQASPYVTLAYTGAWGTGGFFKGTIFQVDIVFNALFNWTTDLSSDQNIIQAIATHEFGHVVGLAHVGPNSGYDGCSNANDHFALTMYQFYCREDGTHDSYRWVTLARGDIKGIFYVSN